MSAFTLRLDPDLTAKLDTVCREKGYTKNGLVTSLIRDFLDKQAPQRVASPSGTKKNLKKLVGIVNLGGDAVTDAENYFG